MSERVNEPASKACLFSHEIYDVIKGQYGDTLHGVYGN